MRKRAHDNGSVTSLIDLLSCGLGGAVLLLVAQPPGTDSQAQRGADREEATHAGHEDSEDAEDTESIRLRSVIIRVPERVGFHIDSVEFGIFSWRTSYLGASDSEVAAFRASAAPLRGGGMTELASRERFSEAVHRDFGIAVEIGDNQVEVSYPVEIELPRMAVILGCCSATGQPHEVVIQERILDGSRRSPGPSSVFLLNPCPPVGTGRGQVVLGPEFGAPP